MLDATGRSARYAEGGVRPLGALALAHTTPLETRAAVPLPGPGGPTGPRERQTWDAGRLIACAELLCSIPSSCRWAYIYQPYNSAKHRSCQAVPQAFQDNFISFITRSSPSAFLVNSRCISLRAIGTTGDPVGG